MLVLVNPLFGAVEQRLDLLVGLENESSVRL